MEQSLIRIHSSSVCPSHPIHTERLLSFGDRMWSVKFRPQNIFHFDICSNKIIKHSPLTSIRINDDMMHNFGNFHGNLTIINKVQGQSFVFLYFTWIYCIPFYHFKRQGSSKWGYIHLEKLAVVWGKTREVLSYKFRWIIVVTGVYFDIIMVKMDLSTPHSWRERVNRICRGKKKVSPFYFC